MPTFKMVAKQGRTSKSTGGIPNSSLPMQKGPNGLNKDSGIVSRHGQEAKGFKGTQSGTLYADNSYGKANARISDKHPAHGVSGSGQPKSKAGRDAMYRPAGSRGATQVNPNSKGASVKVAASGIGLPGGMGGTHNSAQPSAGPQVFSQKNKNLTMGGTGGKPTTEAEAGFSGVHRAGSKVAGSGLGRKKKTSFF